MFTEILNIIFYVLVLIVLISNLVMTGKLVKAKKEVEALEEDYKTLSLYRKRQDDHIKDLAYQLTMTEREREELIIENKELITKLPPVDLGDKTKVIRGWRADWKVTPEIKKQIIKSKGTQEEIAKQFGISRSRVGQIRRG